MKGKNYERCNSKVPSLIRGNDQVMNLMKKIINKANKYDRVPENDANQVKYKQSKAAPEQFFLLKHIRCNFVSSKLLSFYRFRFLCF